jgi:PAS domain S-box-containing protein
MESDKDNQSNPSSNVIRVLHIDDEEDFLYLTKEFVEKMSEGEILVESLQDPMKVFERIKKDNIDVIVCDYLMEDLNGLDLLKQIKQKEYQIPFIIFTGRGREEVVIDALNLGADYYIRKGTDAKSQYTELVHQIRSASRHRMAELALLESEKTIRRERDLTQRYLNEANVMFVIIDKNENVELINKEVTKVTGYTEKDLIGNNWFEIMYPPEVSDEIRFSIQQVMTGMRQPAPYSEVEIRTKSGEKRLIAWHNTLLTDEDGQVTSLLGIGDDITKRKEIEEALQQSEEHYRKLVDTSPYSIVLADLQGNVTFANQQAALMHGVEKPEELIGSSMMEFTAPEDHERVMERMRKQMFSTLIGTFEYTLLKKDGTRFPVEMSASVITDKANKPVALMAIARDLTESKEAEKAIKESEENYRGFVQNFEGIAFKGSVDFKPFFFHGAVERITGYLEEDFIKGDLTWDKLVLPEDMPKLLSIREDLENTPGFSNTMEYRIKNKDGDIRWIRQYVQNIGSTESESFIVQGSLYDITQSKTFEDNLKESEEKFRALFEGIPDAVFVADPETMDIVDCNKQAQLLLGCPREEVVSKKALDLHPEDYRDFTQEKFKQHAEGSEEIFESIVISCGGQRIPVSINASLIMIGGKEYLQGIFRNITERKEVEEKQKQSEILYRTIFESTGTANLIVDIDKNIKMINSRFVEVSGYSKEETENKMKWSDLLSEEEISRFEKLQELHFVDSNLAPDRFETYFYTKDESRMDVLITINSIPNSTDFIVTMVDISLMKEAEKQIQESADLYRTLFGVTGTAMAIARGEDAIVEQINDQLEEWSGYSKEEIEGKMTWHNFVLESELPRYMEYNKQRLIDPSSVPERYEIKVVDKEKNVFTALIHVGVIPDTNNFIISMIDITEMKQIEEELQKSVQLYKTVFEAKGTANMIVGPSRIIKEVNSKLEEVSGYKREDLIGRNWSDFVPELEKDSLLEYSRARQAEPQDIPLFYESTFINRKGDLRNVMVNLTTIPLSENYIVSLFDITDMKDAEEEIKRSELLYRSLFENTGMANIIFDLEASIVLVNSRMEELSGYTKKELEGRKWTEFIPQPELDLMLEYNRRRMIQPESVPNQYETRFITKNGSIRSILIAVTSLPDSNIFLASVADISERSKMVDTLTKQKKELTDFVHLMGHDIRNSLSSIEGYADLLKEGDSQKEMILERINNQTEYLRKLLNRSIELAEAGQVVEKSEKVDLNNLVDEIAKVTIPQNIEVLHDPLVAVKADKEKLSQIFKNLFENAVIHGKPTQIKVESKLHEDEIGLCLANDGEKIDPDIVKEAFESTFTTKEKESIHGLTIVKKLIDAHGWNIRLLNEEDEACFEILIPKEDVTEL